MRWSENIVAVARRAVYEGGALMEGFIQTWTPRARILDGRRNRWQGDVRNMCFSGRIPRRIVAGSYPHNQVHGSVVSSNAALVANGDCDMAISADQGSSVREPASWCGVYGMKPTYGYLPLTSIVGANTHHAAPWRAPSMTGRAVGSDCWSRRTGCSYARGAGRAPAYRERETGVRGLRIGVVREGFAWPQSEER